MADENEELEPFEQITENLETLAADIVFSAFCGSAIHFTQFIPASDGEPASLIYNGKEHREFFNILTKSYEQLSKENIEFDAPQTKTDLPPETIEQIDDMTK